MKKITVFLCLFCFCYCEVQQARTLTIAENGSSKAVIVVAKGAPQPEQHAASELADFLRQITGRTYGLRAIFST